MSEGPLPTTVIHIEAEARNGPPPPSRSVPSYRVTNTGVLTSVKVKVKVLKKKTELVFFKQKKNYAGVFARFFSKLLKLLASGL